MSQEVFPSQRISQFNDRACLGKLKVEDGVLSVTGWTFKGRIRESVKMIDVVSVKGVPSRTGNNVFIQFGEESLIGLRLKKGALFVAHSLNDLAGGVKKETTIPGKTEYRQAV